MTRARKLADLLDSNGDVKATALDNDPTNLSDLGVTATATELNYVDGVTSNIQTQLNAKQATLTAGSDISISSNTISYTGASDLVSDTSPQLGGNLDTNTFNISFGDNDKAKFGASDDLQIYHNGSGSYITEGGTGSLYLQGTDVRIQTASGENILNGTSNGAVTLYNDNASKLATTSTGVNVTGEVSTDTLDVSGASAFGDNLVLNGANVYMQDNDKAIFGNSSDLQIYHNGSHSYIQDNGTGDLGILGDNSVNIVNAANTEYKARFITNGAVELYYNGAKKLATTSTGVDVTGKLTCDGLTIPNYSSAPSSPSKGDLYYNTTQDVIYAYNGSIWIAIFEPPVVATGGTVTTSGGYKYHKFTSSGTLSVTTGGKVEYLIVAGGGGGGTDQGGGGGAGGYISGLATLSSGNHSITVGGGGAGGPSVAYRGIQGGNSSFGSIQTAIGGGGGGGLSERNGGAGGSGGGGASAWSTGTRGSGGGGTSGQGYNGGGGVSYQGTGSSGGGGGGGASQAGVDANTLSNDDGGNGGDGSTWLNGTTYAGGGGGGTYEGNNSGNGGSGGGGKGLGPGSSGSAGSINTGAANTGGGGGGGFGSGSTIAGAGGSGIVIIRYEI